jgi:DNA-binding response OmpR family regulator
MHASASTYAISLDPTESALLSMLLEHEKEILALKKELKEEKESNRIQDGGIGSSESKR